MRHAKLWSAFGKYVCYKPAYTSALLQDRMKLFFNMKGILTIYEYDSRQCNLEFLVEITSPNQIPK
jgi:hypothetical protein